MNRVSFLSLVAVAPIACASPASAEPMPVTLLAWAQKLVDEVTPANNAYGSSPTFVVWADAATNTAARNRSVCSSFVSHVLEQSFGYTAHDIDTWFAQRVPQALDYYKTILAANGFKRINGVSKIAPGDIIAVGYPPGSHPTGHVMIAASSATPRTATAPLEAGTQQYEIDVIDSAASGHGRTDTRHLPGGKFNNGVGRGVLRLYAHADDTIAGHAWSTTPHSVFRAEAIRHIAIGRLDDSAAPHPSGSPGANSQAPDDGASADDAATDE